MIPMPAITTGAPRAEGPRRRVPPSAIHANPAVQIVPRAAPNNARAARSDQKSVASPCPSVETATTAADQRSNPRVPIRSLTSPMGSDTIRVANPADARTAPTSTFERSSLSAKDGATGTIAIQTISDTRKSA